jgi:hypothetical protein
LKSVDELVPLLRVSDEARLEDTGLNSAIGVFGNFKNAVLYFSL